MIPDFVLAGAPRCGTTSLYYYIKDHPSISLPYSKETNFFQRDWDKGIKFYINEYFNNIKYSNITGDISPEYIYYTIVAKRLKKINPNAKILFFLRNPINRTFSEYYGRKTRGDEKRSFLKAINDNLSSIKPERLEFEHNIFKKNYVERSLYSRYLKDYEDIFYGKILYILFEEFINKPTEVLKKIFNFIGVDDSYLPNNLGKVHNSGHKYVRVNFLNNLLWDDNIKNIIKNTIPIQRKYWVRIRRFFSSINDKYIDKKSIPEFEKKLLEEYFSDEIKIIKKIVGMKIDTYWANE